MAKSEITNFRMYSDKIITFELIIKRQGSK